MMTSLPMRLRQYHHCTERGTRASARASRPSPCTQRSTLEASQRPGARPGLAGNHPTGAWPPGSLAVRDSGTRRPPQFQRRSGRGALEHLVVLSGKRAQSSAQRTPIGRPLSNLVIGDKVYYPYRSRCANNIPSRRQITMTTIQRAPAVYQSRHSIRIIQ